MGLTWGKPPSRRLMAMRMMPSGKSGVGSSTSPSGSTVMMSSQRVRTRSPEGGGFQVSVLPGTPAPPWKKSSVAQIAFFTACLRT